MQSVTEYMTYLALSSFLAYVEKLFKELISLRKESPNLLVAREEVAHQQGVPAFLSSMAKKTSKAEALAAKQTRFSKISKKHNSRGNKLAKQAAKSTVKRVPNKRGSRFNIKKLKAK